MTRSAPSVRLRLRRARTATVRRALTPTSGRTPLGATAARVPTAVTPAGETTVLVLSVVARIAAVLSVVARIVAVLSVVAQIVAVQSAVALTVGVVLRAVNRPSGGCGPKMESPRVTTQPLLATNARLSQRRSCALVSCAPCAHGTMTPRFRMT